MFRFGPPWPALLALLFLACGGGEVSRHPAHGVVEKLLPEEHQVVVAHDEIVGLMPAMTMNFYVADPAIQAQLEVGQVIDFVLEHDGRSFKIIAVEVVGRADDGVGWARFGESLVRSDPAPAFELQDEEGRSVSLADFAGHRVLLDFIFTRCPGPCPILTATHVAVQKALSPAVRARTEFVSISLDPEHDSPEVLKRYARERGIDTSDWSLLTGPVDEVEKVVRAFGVGSTRKPDGQIEHLVVTFLIDGQGRIVKRYMGQEHEPSEIVADLGKLAS
jgi:protein SCO1/2